MEYVSGLNASIVVIIFEHEEYLEAVDLASHVGIIHTWLASYFLDDLPLLFVYFQVNNGVLYFLKISTPGFSLSLFQSLTQISYVISTTTKRPILIIIIRLS